MKTMYPLAKIMSPKDKVLGGLEKAANSVDVVLSRRVLEQYPKSFCFVMFVLPHLPDTCENNYMYKQVQNPSQVNKGASVLGSLYFNICPCGVPGADHDGL